MKTDSNSKMEVFGDEEAYAVISEYLNRGVPGTALMLNGPWGCGKTHFIRNTLGPLLEQNDSTYTTLYVSVYGLSKPENIMESILLAKGGYSKIGVRTFKGVSDLLGLAERFFASEDKLTSNLKGSIETNAVNWFDLSYKLICIDDIERASVSADEILGYIHNYLIEHEAVKILIVGNDSELHVSSEAKRGEKSKYTRYKEKVVSRTLSYKASLRSVVDCHIKEGASLDYMKDSLIRFIQKVGIDNYRTVVYIISILDVIQGRAHTKELPDSAIYFTVLIANEYKNGDITSLETIRSYNEISDVIRLVVQSEREQGEVDSSVRFYRKYIEDNHGLYKYYESIASYVINGILDSGLLVSELKESEDLKGAITMLHAFREMEDEALDVLLDEIAIGINEVRYSPYELVVLVDYLEWFVSRNIIVRERADALHEAIERASNKWAEDLSRTDHDWKYDGELYSQKAREYRDRMKVLYHAKRSRSMEEEMKLAILRIASEPSIDRRSYDTVCSMEMSSIAVETIVQSWSGAANVCRKILSHALGTGAKDRAREMSQPEYLQYSRLLSDLDRIANDCGRIGRMLTEELIHSIREELKRCSCTTPAESDVDSLSPSE